MYLYCILTVLRNKFHVNIMFLHFLITFLATRGYLYFFLLSMIIYMLLYAKLFICDFSKFSSNFPEPNNGYRARFLGFSLYVSNTTDRLGGKLCFKDNNFTLATIPPVFSTTCLLRGQYVIYYNERKAGGGNPTGYDQYAFNELCEVEVYG